MKRTKRIFAVLMAVMLASVMMLTGCGEDDDDGEQGAPAYRPEAERLSKVRS